MVPAEKGFRAQRMHDVIISLSRSKRD